MAYDRTTAGANSRWLHQRCKGSPGAADTAWTLDAELQAILALAQHSVGEGGN